MKHLSLAVAVAFSLVGCGGGGSGSSSTSGGNSVTPVQTPVDNKTSNSGSVDAAFVAGAKPRFLLNGIAIQASGNASPLTQTADGAVTAMGNYSISGNPIATQEISGNANYALGRWTVGTVTNGATTNPTTTTMDGNSNNAFHYVVFNSLAALPANGAMTCNAGKFTKPTYVGGSGTSPGKDAYAGTATGNASITFDGSGGHVNLTVSANVLGSSGTANFSGNVMNETSMYLSGGLGGVGNNAMVTLGDAGNGSVNVVLIYTLALANNNAYRGSAIFTCK